MKTKSKLLLAALLLPLTFSIVSAQDSENTASMKTKLLKGVSFGVNMGPMVYFGDLRVHDWMPVANNRNEWGLGIAAQLNKQLNSVFSLQGQLLTGNFSGTSPDRQPIDLVLNGVTTQKAVYFKCNTREMVLNGVFHLSNLILSKNLEPKKLSYYVTAGVGLTSFRSSVWDLATEEFVGGIEHMEGYNESGERDKRTRETIIPWGFGVKYKLKSNLDLGFEMTSRLGNTDKFDAYPEGGGANDFYTYTAVGLTYKLTAKGTVSDVENPLEEMTAEVLKGQEKIGGLSSDSDSDGVADIFDQEANTQKGVAVDGSGKSLDIDEDGVADYMDADRFTPKGATVDANGRELDADGDAVPNSRDLEPNTKQGALVNFQGITINAAPTSSTSTTVTSGGGSGYLPSVFFKTGSASVDYSNYERLATIAQVMKANPNVKVNVVGNADKTGSESINMEISKRRAQSVVDHLVKIYGISASRFNVVAKGSQAPLASDGASSVNRRVDFEVTK